VYQRIALLDSSESVSEMQDELRDRYGPVPPAVEHLLFVALVKAVARRARVENIQTSEQLIHIRGRSGITDGQRQRVAGLGLKGMMVGPNQVRIDRVAAGEAWMPLLVRVLRAMAVRE
jgi:transcription-repair coupling factor (superfamily II helicase)